MADKSYFQGGFGTGGDATFLGDLTASDRLLYNNAYVLTTADDTTTTLTVSSYPDVLCVGSGILQWIDLGDATTYAVGKEFRITNASTEIVGVKNSDNSTWYRLPPRWELSAVCTSIGSAAGSWFVSVRPGITAQDGLFLLDDFMGGTAANCNMGWLTVTSGAGAAIGTLSGTVGDYTGILVVQTGTTATGYAQIYTRSSLLTTNCVNSCLVKLRINVLSTAAEEYIVRLGFGDSTDMSDHTDGMYFEYDRLTNGDVWSINTAAASSRTETATATAVALNTYYNLLVESASDASRVDYWINQNYVGSVTTDIPGASDSYGVHAGIVKSAGAGATSSYIYVDYVALGRYPVAER